MEQKHTKQVLYRGNFISFIKDNNWEYVERTHPQGAVAILAVNKKDQIVLVEQYRPPLKKNAIELPAGLIGDKSDFANETWETSAQRELIEETGYSAKSFSYLTEGPSSPGLCSEIIILCLANEIEKTGPGGGDNSESIIVHEIPLREIDSWLEKHHRSGKWIDPKVYSGLYFLNKFYR